MNIALIDYGTGNLHSLIKALELGGARVSVEQQLDRALHAEGIVLPGVGAFGAAASQLGEDAPLLQQAIANGKPCLGICLGMQLLFERSEEGLGTGLSVLSGHIRRLFAPRLPHIGWNQVIMADDPLFDGLSDLVAYYANGFAAEPSDDTDVIAWTQYGSDRFPAAVRRGKVWGVQFHPEKSGPAGLRVIRNFLAQVS
jgi:imidazole glycerol-phosphate synthase subunit HisH